MPKLKVRLFLSEITIFLMFLGGNLGGWELFKKSSFAVYSLVDKTVVVFLWYWLRKQLRMEAMQIVSFSGKERGNS